MTREEAIRELKIQFVGEYDRQREAKDMAIKALEQEPCDDTVSRGVFEQVMWERDTAIEQLRKLGYELGQKVEPCGDCVSRQEVCNIANDIKDYCVSMYNPNDASEAEIINYIYKYVDALYDLPSVTPKRERGEWICDDFIESIYHCSLCQGKIKGKLSKYCPHCGAEMR